MGIPLEPIRPWLEKLVRMQKNLCESLVVASLTANDPRQSSTPEWSVILKH
jgi:hypothetical protein